MKRKLVVGSILVLLAAGTVAGQKLQHRVKLSQLNEWQALVSCRNGKTPQVSQEIAGNLVVSCQGPELPGE